MKVLHEHSECNFSPFGVQFILKIVQECMRIQ